MANPDLRLVDLEVIRARGAQVAAVPLLADQRLLPGPELLLQPRHDRLSIGGILAGLVVVEAEAVAATFNQHLLSAARSLPGSKSRCRTVRKMARSMGNSKRRPFSSCWTTCWQPANCQSLWETKAGPMCRIEMTLAWHEHARTAEGPSEPGGLRG